jgi:phosphoglycolate phosphatase-like HAD superfamily hydrolase
MKKNKFNNFKLIFWDFDGVIKDSVEVKSKAFVKLFAEYNSKIKNKIKIHHEKNGGMSRFDKIPIYLNYANIEANKRNINLYCKKFSKLVFNEVILSKWVKGVLSYLKSNKYNQIFILISATPAIELKAIINELKLNNNFQEIYGAPSKKSFVIKKILKKYKINKSDALMVGDAQVDIDAANYNKINFLLRRHKLNKHLKFNGNTIKNFSKYG